MISHAGTDSLRADTRVAEGARRRAAGAAARRRALLLLFAVVVVITISVLANLGPLHHLLAAQERLANTNASIVQLQAKKDELQAQLARLGESAYLEALAREEMAYVRPGEELYVVTDPSNSTTVSSGRLGLGASLPGAGKGVVSRTDGAAEDSQSARPGFFERILTAIADLF